MKLKKPAWWIRIEASVTNTKLYIWFIGRPMRNAPNGAYLLYWVAIFFAFVAFTVSSGFYEEYVTLDQMDQETVVILKAIYSDRRSGHEAWLRFRTMDGVEKKYAIAASKDVVAQIDDYREKKAKIWIDHVYRHIYPYYLIRELRVGGKTLVRYRYRSPEEVAEANKNGNAWIFWIFVSSILTATILVAYIVLSLGRRRPEFNEKGES